MRFALLLAGVFACGGQIQGGDAGTPMTDSGGVKDVITSADVTVGCSMASGVATMGKDTCGIEEAWQCGATAYNISCSCLAGSANGTCSCTEMTGTMGSGTMVTAPPGVCPSCVPNLTLMAQTCGFPH